MKTWLVTGGAGFIGSHFVRLALATYRNIRIVNLDKLTYAGNLQNISQLRNHPRYTFVQGDIRDRAKIEQFTKNCQYIVNFAAETHVDRSIKDASQFIKTNVLGTHTLLKYARKNDVSRFVHISTDEVYGPAIRSPFKEDDSLNPSNPYAASKAAADHLCLSYWTTYRLPVILVRPSNNFGPNQYPEKIIPLFITNTLLGLSLPLYGDGRQRRDWTWVEDTCRAIMLVLDKGLIGNVYNVASHQEISNRDLASLILKLAKNLKLDSSKSTQIAYVPDRPGHDLRYAMDTSKIKKNLGWAPQNSFLHDLKRSFEWYRNNVNWWKDIRAKNRGFYRYCIQHYGKRFFQN